MSARFGTNDLLACYRRGVFPMGDARDDPNLFLVDPDMRGILPLDDFHIPKRLKTQGEARAVSRNRRHGLHTGHGDVRGEC
jgi:Leu/Phe-tRNA-protein transferase